MTARRVRFDIRQAGPRILILLLVLATLNGGFYLLLTRPKVREYTDLAVGSQPQLTRLEERKQEVETQERFLEALRTAQNDLQRLRQEVLSTRSQRLVEVQQELAALCGQFSIDLESVIFESELLEHENLDKQIMVVPLTGNYANLRRFLQAVESSEKFLLVEQVALTEARMGGVMLELNITLATYFDMPQRNGGGRV
jgi:Tfp pilus assembly protein PilO